MVATKHTVHPFAETLKLNIYTTSGVLVRSLSLNEGETATVPLERGIYVVVPYEGKAKKVLIH